MKLLLLAALVTVAVVLPACGGEDKTYKTSCAELQDERTMDKVAGALVDDVDLPGSKDQVKRELKARLSSACGVYGIDPPEHDTVDGLNSYTHRK